MDTRVRDFARMPGDRGQATPSAIQRVGPYSKPIGGGMGQGLRVRRLRVRGGFSGRIRGF